MNIKDYENKLKENKIDVVDFGITQAYYIKTNLGVIHINKEGIITSITGNDNTRIKLCEIFNYPTQRTKKRWEYKVDYLESRIAYLEQLLKSNNIQY